MRQKILCIEDDSTIQALAKCSLPDYDIYAALTLKDAREKLKSKDFSAVLLDLELPDGDGLTLLSDLYLNKDFKTPVIILSSHQEIQNKVMAFSLGAEDFLEKPFNPIELSIRVTSRLRKIVNNHSDSQQRIVGNLRIDLELQCVHLLQSTYEEKINLTNIEFKILSILTHRLEQVFTRNQLLESIWKDVYINDRTIDSHVAHLRRKISNSSVLIETVKNLGYRAVLKK